MTYDSGCFLSTELGRERVHGQGNGEEIDGITRPGKPSAEYLQPLDKGERGKTGKKSAIVDAWLLARDEIAEEVRCGHDGGCWLESASASMSVDEWAEEHEKPRRQGQETRVEKAGEWILYERSHRLSIIDMQIPISHTFGSLPTPPHAGV